MELTYGALGNTDEGRQFSLVHLHPCGEYISDCPGIPDESSVLSVTPAFRGDSVLSLSPGLWEPPLSPDDLRGDFRYDVQVVTVPYPEIEYLYRIRIQARAQGWSRWIVKRTPGFAGARGEWKHGPGGLKSGPIPATLGNSGYSSVRCIARGITIHLDAPSLADQGHVVAGQVPLQCTSVIRHFAPVATPDAAGRIGNANAASVRFDELRFPNEPGELIAQDPMAAQWDARDGTYIPLRFQQPVHTYGAVDRGRVFGVASVGMERAGKGKDEVASDVGLVVPEVVFGIRTNARVDPNGELRYSDSYDRIFTPPPPGEGSWGFGILGTEPGVYQTTSELPTVDRLGFSVSGPLNHMVAVQFYLGISNTAQLRVKTRLYLECEAAGFDSPVAPFLHRAPLADRRSLEMVTLMEQSQQHVFYARDNDLSSILRSIGVMLPGVLNAMSTSGIPVVNTLGSWGRRLGGWGNNLFHGFAS